MTARECLKRVVNNECMDNDVRYCLVDEKKNPFRFDGQRARVNKYDDFVSLEEMSKSAFLDLFKGLGISIQASGLSGVDIDHCIAVPNDFSSCNELGEKIVDIFKDIAYIEFSFSGTGLRILFRTDNFAPYKDLYYIKNSNIGVEFYQPMFDNVPSNRFLTLTGNAIYRNKINYIDNSVVKVFLDEFMRKKETKSSVKVDTIKDSRTIEELLKEVRKHYRKDYSFMEDWFCDGKHPSDPNISDESERDYRLIDYLYTNITSDKARLKEVFEQSPFFKTKDFKHMNKWEYNNNRYYNYQYEVIKKKHS